MKMPNPIAIRFAKLIFSILSITVLGVIFAMISHDHKLLILSAGVSITGGVKACSFYRQVSRQQYECLEGLLVQEQVNIHRKRHAIVLELENGSHVQRVLDGRYKLKAGSLYRFYLKKPTNDLPNLPEALQPSSTVFGFEKLPAHSRDFSRELAGHNSMDVTGHSLRRMVQFKW